MVQERYGVQLSTPEKGRLRQMIRAGRSSAPLVCFVDALDTRARILLKTDEGWPFGRLRSISSGCSPGHLGAHGVPRQAAVRRGGTG